LGGHASLGTAEVRLLSFDTPENGVTPFVGTTIELRIRGKLRRSSRGTEKKGKM